MILKNVFYLQFFLKLSQIDYNVSNPGSNILRKIRIAFQISFKKISYFYKLIKNSFLKIKIDKNIKLIILAKHKYIDQLNFFPLSNQIKKKHLVFFNLYNDYSKIYKEYKNQFVDLNYCINIFDFFKGLKNYYSLSPNFNNFPLKYDNKFFIKNFYKDFFIKLEFYKRIFKDIEPKYFLSSPFFGDEALIYYFRKIRKLKTKFYSLELNGIGGDSCRYLYHFADLVLVPGKIDIEIAEKLKKKSIRSNQHTKNENCRQC